MKRRKSHKVTIGKVTIGGNSPVAIQSMTNTDTADVSSTVQQIIELIDAGSELVRITVNNEAAALAVPDIKETLLQKGYYGAPLIGDFHYNGHLLLTRFQECAQALDKYRINPGNVGSGALHDYNFATMIEVALKYKKPVRIGVNWGSLDKELFTKIMEENGEKQHPKSDQEVLIDTLVESAISSALQAEKLGMPADKIVLSVKTSEVQAIISAYQLLAARTPYALHLGLTEAGMGMKAIVASSAALAVLLQQGIGDTIRISLTPAVSEPRMREVKACQLLLQTMGLRQFRPLVTSCPGCGRTGNDLFQRLTEEINEYITKRMPEWKQKHAGIENMKVAVMGCVVNGPGESQHADISLSLPGRSEEPIATVFIHGKAFKTLRGGDVGKEFLEILEQFIPQNFPPLLL